MLQKRGWLDRVGREPVEVIGPAVSDLQANGRAAREVGSPRLGRSGRCLKDPLLSFRENLEVDASWGHLSSHMRA